MIIFRSKKILLTTTLLATLLLGGLASCFPDKEKEIVQQNKLMGKQNQQIVQLAELEIDSIQLDNYLEFLTEEVETSLAIEPGVLMLYAMRVEDNPTKVKLVEIYAHQAAYESHIASPHFQKYKKGTLNMVKSLKLTRMNSISAASKIK